VAVDVLTEVEIARPRGEVATYASDPDNATAWYENIKTVEWKTARQALSVGARVAFTAAFMGRRLAYIYEITDFVPPARRARRESAVHVAAPLRGGRTAPPELSSWPATRGSCACLTPRSTSHSRRSIARRRSNSSANGR